MHTHTHTHRYIYIFILFCCSIDPYKKNLGKSCCIYIHMTYTNRISFHLYLHMNTFVTINLFTASMLFWQLRVTCPPKSVIFQTCNQTCQKWLPLGSQELWWPSYLVDLAETIKHNHTRKFHKNHIYLIHRLCYQQDGPQHNQPSHRMPHLAEGIETQTEMV